MYCKNCGIKIDDDSSFCYKCGTKQTTSQNLKIELNDTNCESTKENSNNHSINTFRDNTSYKGKSPLDEKFDTSYVRDVGPIFVGIIFLIANYFYMVNIGKLDGESLLYVISGMMILIRVLLMFWCGTISRTLNRDTTGWMIFGFLSPGLTLIILGFHKKLLYNDLYKHMSDKNKSLVNSKISGNMLKVKKYNDSFVFSNLSIEQDSENHVAYAIRGFVYYSLVKYKSSLEDLSKSIQLHPKDPNVFYHRGLTYIKLGDKVNALKDFETSVGMGHYLSKFEIEKYS